MPVSGDMSGLRALKQKLERLKGDSLKRQASQALGGVAVGLASDCFQKSRDPYGVAWKPLLYRSGKPLLDTGRLRNSIHYSASAGGFSIETNVEYARIHNEGGKVSIPARVQTNYHARNGRFMRGSRALKSKRPVTTRQGIIGGHSVTIPERRFIPRPSFIGPIWTAAFTEALNDFMDGVMG